MQVVMRLYPVVDGRVKIGCAPRKWASIARRLVDYTATIALGVAAGYWILRGFGR